MQERGKSSVDSTQCSGGRSFNCRHDEHPKGKHSVSCFRCGAYLGCSICAERASEVICLECNNFGHRKGIAKHGNVVPNRKVPRVRTDNGWITDHAMSNAANRWIERSAK